jgi:hypothetical protein
MKLTKAWSSSTTMMTTPTRTAVMTTESRNLRTTVSLTIAKMTNGERTQEVKEQKQLKTAMRMRQVSMVTIAKMPPWAMMTTARRVR